MSFLKLSASPPPEGVDEAASTVPPTDGTTMRWDAVAQQYIYNLATKQLTDSSATYRIKVTGPSIATTYSDVGIKPQPHAAGRGGFAPPTPEQGVRRSDSPPAGAFIPSRTSSLWNRVDR